MKITNSENNISRLLDIRRGRIPCGKRRCSSRHSDCFVLVCSGSADYTFDGNVHTAQGGDLIYLGYLSRYTIDISCNDYTFIYIDFLFDNTEDERPSNKVFKAEKLSEPEGLFEQFYRSWKAGTYADRLYCKALLYMIYSQAARSEITQYVSRERRNDIERIAQFMSDNLHDTELSVARLSALCGVSEVHFRRLFEYIYHTSPAKFLSFLRVRRAKELLISDSLSMLEISELCGFRNQYYFSKVFKKVEGMSPREYVNSKL